MGLDRRHVALSLARGAPGCRPDRRPLRIVLLVDAEARRRQRGGLLTADATRRLEKACAGRGFLLNFCRRCRECDRPAHEPFAVPGDKRPERIYGEEPGCISVSPIARSTLRGTSCAATAKPCGSNRRFSTSSFTWCATASAPSARTSCSMPSGGGA